MKSTYFVLLISILLLGSCSDHWDNYYKKENISGDVREEILSGNLRSFFESHSDYGRFYDWLKQAGVDKELDRDQYMTIWAVNNETFDAASPEISDTLSIRYHANYLSFGITNLKDGLRIKALNNIYIQINQDGDNGFLINKEARILDSYRVENGVVYVIDRLLEPKLNLFDYLMNLGDDYSIIRDSIFKENRMLFDKANSTPVSVDKTGNTVYDSVFYVYNPIFEYAEFNSQFKQFTAFVPSNEVIENCFEKLAVQYKLMGQTFASADSVLAMTWIKEAMFYNGFQTDFPDEDIKSVYSRIWRTTVQELDLDNPVELSNGIVYNVTNLKVPNNVIISRIKSLVHYWEYLSEEERAELYVCKGHLDIPSVATLDATPKPEILANYIVFHLSGDPESSEEFSVEFVPLERYMDETGTYRARIMKVPPGEYNFYMGFHSQVHPYVDVYFNDELLRSNIKASDSSPWNYDRVNETEADRVTGGKAKWDGLGGMVGTVMIEGEEMTSFKVKVKMNKLNSVSDPKRLRIYHWALKPTENNY